MLDGLDVFMLKIAVDLKIEQLKYDKKQLEKKKTEEEEKLAKCASEQKA